MRTPKGIYAEYRIPPWLQMHQLRVAAVGSIVCDACMVETNKNDVILASLFHDMGNILKFDFSSQNPLSSLIRADEVSFWQNVRDDFVKKYGTDEHEATNSIVRELGLSEAARGVIDSITFSNVRALFESGSHEWLVCQYADMRVGPHGIISLRARITDLKERYASGSKLFGNPELSRMNEQALQEIESRLFAGADATPEDINDASTGPIIEELWEYPVR